MINGEAATPDTNNEAERLQGLGFERVGTSDFVLGGGHLVKCGSDDIRLYRPCEQVNCDQVKAIYVHSSGDADGRGVRVEVYQMPSPKRMEKGFNEPQYLDLSTKGKKGPIASDDISSITRLSALSQFGITQQLERSGFEVENETNGTTLMRLRQPNGEEVVAVVVQNELKGLFIPTYTAHRTGEPIDHSKLKVIGIATIPRVIGSAEQGIRVSNDWAEFTLDGDLPLLLDQPKIIREPTPEEIGLAPIPKIVESSGFVQGGVNSTDKIKRLESINGISVSKLNEDMRPGALSEVGFLGEHEDVLGVMVRDNQTVLEHGLTHQDLALPLRYIQRMYELGMLVQTSGHVKAEINELTIGGHRYAIGISGSRGSQESPFGGNEGKKTAFELTVFNIETRKWLMAPSPLAEMIARYGFYEGNGTRYRVAPETIIDTFTHLKPKTENSI